MGATLLPGMQGVERALGAMAKIEAVGPDDLLAELLNLGRNEAPATLTVLDGTIISGRRGSEVPQKKNNAIIKVQCRKKDETQCGNYRRISLFAHAGMILLQVVAYPLSSLLRDEGHTSRGAGRFPPQRSIVGMCRSLGGREGSLFSVFYRPAGSVQLRRPLPWGVLTRFGVLKKIIEVA